MRKLSLLLAFITLAILVNSCKKDNIKDILIEIETDNYNFSEQDTIFVQYVILATSIDSVCLLINSVIVDTKHELEGVLFYRIPNSDNITLKAIAYSNGSTETSKSVDIHVNKLYSPELSFRVKSKDYEFSYFVGERLIIDVRPRWAHIDINDFKNVSLTLNGEYLDTIPEPPFVFDTPIINSTGNLAIVTLTDTNGRIHNIQHELIVPINTPPVIDIGVWHHMDYDTGFYMSIDPVILSYEGSDNINVEYIDFYFDNQYHSTDSIDSDWFFGERLILDSLPVGYHEFKCVAHDDRNLSTTSELIPVIIYQTYKLTEEIIEVKPTEKSNVAYAISNSKLFVINPNDEVITDEIDLPYIEPSSMDYISENQKLYIGFNSGELVSWDYNTQSFTVIANSIISNIGDIAIDYSTNTALTISNNNLVTLNLTTLDFFTTELELFEGSSLAYNEDNKIIIVGGKPHSSGNKFYKCLYLENEIQVIEDKRFSYYTKEIIMHPNGNDFIICTGANNSAIQIYSLDNFGTQIGIFSPNGQAVGALNKDGTKFYTGHNSLRKKIVEYNYPDINQYMIYKFPLHDYEYVTHIIPTLDNSKLVLTTSTTFSDDVRLVFLRF